MDRLGALREANFRRLWVGQTTSAFGDALAGVALTFGILGVTGSAVDLGLVLTAFIIPRVVFLLVGGVWADRIPRRTIMLGADIVRALAQAALAVAFLSGAASLPIFIAAAAATGAASAFFVPASIGLVPQAVSAERLQPANALLNLSQSSAFLAGPVVSGLLLVTIGPGWIFAIDAVTFGVSAAALAMLRLPALPPIATRPFLADLAIGWREVVSRSWLVASLAGFAFVNLAFAGFFVIAPVMVERSYGGAPDWGILMAGFGLGGILGGALALRWSPGRPLVAVFAVLLAAPLTLLFLAGLPPFALLAVAVIVFAAGTAFANTIWHTTLQRQVPAESISRVSSYDWMASLLFFPIGSALAGPLSEALGPPTALIGFAVASGVAMVGTLAVPAVRALRRIEVHAIVDPPGTPDGMDPLAAEAA
jgi:MFS family permease